MTWFLHSCDSRSRRVSRRGPFETEELATIAACKDQALARTPLLIEGPGGVKLEGRRLAEIVAASQQDKKRRRTTT